MYYILIDEVNLAAIVGTKSVAITSFAPAATRLRIVCIAHVTCPIVSFANRRLPLSRRFC